MYGPFDAEFGAYQRMRAIDVKATRDCRAAFEPKSFMRPCAGTAAGIDLRFQNRNVIASLSKQRCTCQPANSSTYNNDFR
jgi:hypothetical protein